MLDGVSVVDEDGANVCISIMVQYRAGMLSVKLGWSGPIWNRDSLQQLRRGSSRAAIGIESDKLSCLTPQEISCEIILLKTSFTDTAGANVTQRVDFFPTHSIISSGFSTTFLSSLIHSPPTAPSTTL